MYKIRLIRCRLSFSTLTDDELFSAIKEGDQKAFAEFFRRHWAHVYTMTYSRVRSQQITQEIVQDLFTSIWHKRASLSINNLRSYLYTAVKNRVLNYFESQIVQRKYHEYCKHFLPHHNVVLENDLELKELMTAVENGINRLPAKSKQIFLLNRFEGRSLSEISDMLKLSKKAIQYHLTQSTKKLRLTLKDYMLGFLVANLGLDLIL